MERFLSYGHFGQQIQHQQHTEGHQQQQQAQQVAMFGNGNAGDSRGSDVRSSAVYTGNGGRSEQQDGNTNGGTASRMPAAQSIFGSTAYEDPFLQQARAAAALAEMDVKGLSQSVFSSTYPSATASITAASEFDASSALLHSAQQSGQAAERSSNSFQAEMAALCQQQMVQAAQMQAMHCFAAPVHYAAYPGHSMHFQHASLPTASFGLHQQQHQQQQTQNQHQQQHVQQQQLLQQQTHSSGSTPAAVLPGISALNNAGASQSIVAGICGTGVINSTSSTKNGTHHQPRYPTALHAAHLSASELDTDPRELERFAEHFKQRRIKLGVTQADVGKALAYLKMPGVGSLSQSTICRFESLTLSHNNMVALKPILQSWLERAEEATKQAAKEGPEGLMHCSNAGGILPCTEKKRKRTSIAAPEKRLLEDFFRQQSRPTGDRISMIAEKLDLKKNVVRVWFCNQRQKQKRNQFRNSRGSGGTLHQAVSNGQLNQTGSTATLGSLSCNPAAAAASLAAVAMQAMQQQQQRNNGCGQQQQQFHSSIMPNAGSSNQQHGRHEDENGGYVDDANEEETEHACHQQESSTNALVKKLEGEAAEKIAIGGSLNLPGGSVIQHAFGSSNVKTDPCTMFAIGTTGQLFYHQQTTNGNDEAMTTETETTTE